MRSIEELLAEIEVRTKAGHKEYYQPLESSEERNILVEYYLSQTGLSEGGIDPPVYLVNKAGLLLSRGYERIVASEYGAYVEIEEDQIVKEHIAPKWSGTPSRPVKYIWMESRDAEKTKVYLQQGTVKYADYQPGKYYISVTDVRGVSPEESDLIEKPEITTQRTQEEKKMAGVQISEKAEVFLTSVHTALFEKGGSLPLPKGWGRENLRFLGGAVWGVRYTKNSPEGRPQEVRVLTQNIEKSSPWSQLAREGHRVTHVYRNGEWLCVIVDGKISKRKGEPR